MATETNTITQLMQETSVKEQKPCPYCGALRHPDGMARHQRSKKCLLARHKQTIKEIANKRDQLKVTLAEQKAEALKQYNARIQQLEASHKADLSQLCQDYKVAKAYVDNATSKRKK